MPSAVSDSKITKPCSSELYCILSEPISPYQISRKSLINLTVLPAQLTFQLKQVRLTDKCMNHMYHALNDPKFIQIGWSFYKFKEHIQLPMCLDGSGKVKLDYTVEYRLEVDEEFIRTMQKTKATFDLSVANNVADITLGKTEICFVDVLERANKKRKKTICFTNGDVDVTNYVAAMEVSFKCKCNRVEMKKLCEVVRNQTCEEEEETVIKIVEPSSGDSLEQNLLGSDSTNIAITVVKLFFMENSRPMFQDSIKNVYVEYSFLGEEGPELESPFSLPKGTYSRPTIFNWTKTFNIDIEESYTRCKALTQLIKNNDVVKFFVISEPPESVDSSVQICEYVGYAEVFLKEILRWETDVDTYQYEILDICNSLVVVGYITITFEGIAAMKKVLSKFMVPSD